jgi:hypothetical protein
MWLIGTSRCCHNHNSSGHSFEVAPNDRAPGVRRLTAGSRLFSSASARSWDGTRSVLWMNGD